MRDLVLLHGWGMNSAVWGELLEPLSTGFRLHPLELPGHGEMPYRDEQTLDDWARAMLAIAPDRATWLGWSLGGQVAMQAALLAPQRVERLLLTASAPRFVQAADWPNAMPVGTLGQFARSLSDDYRGAISRFLALQVRGSEQGREVLRGLKAGLVSRPEADPSALTVGLQLLRQADLRPQLADLSCPHAWCFGERDSLIPAPMAEDLAQLQPTATITRIDGAAHAPFLSHSAQWLDWVQGALS